jgi:hypothetical protein
MKAYRGIGGIAPDILDLRTGWRFMFAITPRPLCTVEKKHDSH